MDNSLVAEWATLFLNKDHVTFLYFFIIMRVTSSIFVFPKSHSEYQLRKNSRINEHDRSGMVLNQHTMVYLWQNKRKQPIEVKYQVTLLASLLQRLQ